MLGIHHRTVQQMARDGIIPAYLLGEGRRKTWRFLCSENSRVDAGEGKLGEPSVSLESEETELSKTRYRMLPPLAWLVTRYARLRLGSQENG
jgi:hypothetical protein